MMVFWRHGYAGASLADLTAAMGINAPSLYACFGSKEGLFRAVLERYGARQKTFMESVLAAPCAHLVAETFLAGVADFATDNGKNPPGCLSLQGGLSCADARIPDALARFRSEKEAMLRARFERARESGDLPESVNPAELARYLIVIANGICVQAASGASAQELRQVARLALSGWPGVRNATPSLASERG
jgi:AcrR family transcriptional regulator